ncbi:MAG: FeoB-associated Cys-rich membrane protein [Paludibacteraceae bacterium]|nr:FeoB-associated Cys-rich membrane protein [Paludibacteraceae bacterium]
MYPDTKMNLQTIITAFIVAAALIAVAVYTYRAFTGKSKSGCGCGCQSCGMAGNCNKPQKEVKDEAK